MMKLADHNSGGKLPVAFGGPVLERLTGRNHVKLRASVSQPSRKNSLDFADAAQFKL